MTPTFSRRTVFGLFGGMALSVAGALSIGRSHVARAEADPATPTARGAGGEILLRVEISGGLIPSEFLFTNLPAISVYTDGRVIFPGPMIEIYPQPALPNLRMIRMTGAGIDRVLHEADVAGLFDGSRSYSIDTIADAPSTVFTLHAGEVSTVVSAYALGLDETMVQDETERAARAKLIEFQSFLGDLPGKLNPDEIAAGDSAFPIDRLRIYTREIDPANPPWQDPALEQEPVSWPLATPLSAFGDPLKAGPSAGETRCAAVEGADAEILVAALAKANELTPWESTGVPYQLWVRPLLPDESGCPA